MEAMARRDAKIRQLPTIYTFNFKDVPSEVYAKTLEAIFSDPQFADAVRNRNELVRAANRIPQGAPQMAPLIKAIQEKDAKLANAIYALLVQVNLHSEITYDFLSFGHLSRYYVDYSQPGMQEKVDHLNINLDKITFLSEMLENLLTQVKGDMLEIFKGASEFQQFDGVMASLRQLAVSSISPARKTRNRKITPSTMSMPTASITIWISVCRPIRRSTASCILPFLVSLRNRW